MLKPIAGPLLVLLLISSSAFAQLIEPDHGVARGTVSAKDVDYLFLKPTDDIARRYYVRGGDTANRTVIANLSTGQTVEIHWTRDDRRRIDSIQTAEESSATPASTAAAAQVAPSTRPSETTTAPTAPTPSAATSATVGERVNAGLDDLLAFGDRAAELPLWMPLIFISLAGASLLAVARQLDRRGRPIGAKQIRVLGGTLAVLLVAYCMDRKVHRLQTELNTLRARLTPTAFAFPQAAASTDAAALTKPPAVTATRSFLFDPDSAKSSLAAHFQDVTLRPSICDSATDVVQINFGQPQVAAFLAVVDLFDPAVRIQLGTNLQTKTLTSDFAKAAGSTIAINGEAGQSPAMNSGFGAWRGWLVADGKTLFEEQPGNPRPFLAFDVNNRASYRPMATADRTLPANKPTVIWGRLDALIDGVVQTENERFRQPRTAMGINADGTKLFLLVADGRQNGYSVGLTREEVGQVLKAFGAAHGMLCDEGGSSCLYVQRAGGIVNLPSDNGGEERPTYTHFGVSVRG